MNSLEAKPKEFDDTEYTPDASYNTNDIEGCLETYSPDVDEAVHLANTTPKKVWTIVDGDDGNICIVAGYHLVNRVMYLITKEDWEDENEQYLWYDSNANEFVDEDLDSEED